MPPVIIGFPSNLADQYAIQSILRSKTTKLDRFQYAIKALSDSPSNQSSTTNKPLPAPRITTTKMIRFVLLVAVLLCFALSTCALPSVVQSLSPTMTMRQRNRAGRPFNSFRALNRRRRRIRRFLRQCRAVLRSQFRTQSGRCNNLQRPNQGAADQPFLLLTRPLRPLANGLAGPNPRNISNIVCDEQATIPNDRGMSELVTFFGQLLDHTVTFIPIDEEQPLPIKIPANDPVFSESQYIPFFRTEKSNGAPINELSSYVDAASVYAVGDDESTALRELKGGRLRLPDNFLPRDDKGQFLAGDIRVNENVNLIALHTIFAREHNRVAAEVATAYPPFNDEQIYQLARHIVTAEMQAVVYHEFIPALTGSKLPRYRGYRRNVQGVVSNEFSTAAFRVGHTLLNTTVTSIGPDGSTNSRALRDAFFKPQAFLDDTLEGLFRGMMRGFASEVDNGITGEVRNFLIDEPKSEEQLDLPALNIQRGRDHGLPVCNRVRRRFGLAPFTSFQQMSSNSEVVARLQTAYASVDDVDTWVCGISEDHAPGSSLGVLFNRIVRSEFTRLRDGDRFYFENPRYFTPDQIRRIATIRTLVGRSNQLGNIMKLIITRNSEIPASEINNPFFV